MLTAAELLGAAENEQALPLLLHVLGKKRLRPSEHQLALARGQLAANTLDDRVLRQELATLTRALAREGVPIILLKGAALRATLYAPGLRPMNDLDFLIRPVDRGKTAQVLASLGYRCTTTVVAPDPSWESTWLKNDASRVCIEPHWAFWPLSPTRHAAAVAEMWGRALPVTVQGVPTRVLCPEDALLHLCVHLPAHEDHRWVVPICDVRSLLSRHDGCWDWGAFMDRAAALGVSRLVEYSLGLAARAIDAPVPPERLAILGRLEHGPIAWLTTRALETTPSQARTFVLQMLSERGARARTRLVTRSIFASREHVVSRYGVRHARFYWFFYLWRALVAVRVAAAVGAAIAKATCVAGRDPR